MTGTYFSIIKWSDRLVVQKFSKNAEATFKFYAPEGWGPTILPWLVNLSAPGPL